VALIANEITAKMVAEFLRVGWAAVAAERVQADGKVIDVRRYSITEAGRRAIAMGHCNGLLRASVHALFRAGRLGWRPAGAGRLGGLATICAILRWCSCSQESTVRTAIAWPMANTPVCHLESFSR